MAERRDFLQRIRNPKPTVPTLVLSKILMCVLPIAKIAIGVVYLNDCPRQHYIPIYLVVMGVFGLALSLLSCLPCAQEPEEGTQHNPFSRICTVWNTLASLFLFCWFISGNVWIYSIYQPNYNQTMTEDPYCNKTLYLFAFWTTTLLYVVLGLLLLGDCCVLTCLCMCGKSDPDDHRGV